MPDGLYERDIVLWAERQADLLRRVAAGERLNEDVDWNNVIEEVEDVGRSEYNACASYLGRALEHLIKLHNAPQHRAARKWRSEAGRFLIEAERHFTPSMAGRIDLDREYRRALRQFALDWPGAGPALPAACPFTLSELLSDQIAIPDFVVKLSPGS